LNSELREMKAIIDEYKIDEFNYNMIYKFYNDIIFSTSLRNGDFETAKGIISIFDNEIYNKVKDWSSPFDIAFFDTEFGKLFFEMHNFILAKERFEKALAYNSNYLTAKEYLKKCDEK
jgi:hypothetical protein